jgi:hypothetical protein
MLRTRGYSAATYSAISSAYRNKPTPFQLASYGVYIIDLIRKSDIQGLKEAFDLGISPNACNAHGESIVHNICRRCDVHVLEVLLQSGCEIQISDDNGHTPLHDACRAHEPNFPLVTKLLDLDIRLLYMADSHGHLPLSYTRRKHWSEWLQFLQSKKDVYWPRNTSIDGSAAPPLSLLEPNSRPIPDPENALSLQLASMFAGGKLQPDRVVIMKQIEQSNSPHVGCNDSDSDSDDDDDNESDYSSDSDDESEEDSIECETTALSNEFDASWDEEAMKAALESIDSSMKRPLSW